MLLLGLLNLCAAGYLQSKGLTDGLTGWVSGYNLDPRELSSHPVQYFTEGPRRCGR